jgi:serine/threonine protein kinase
MAPEVVKQSIYTKKADIWSVGCLIVEMLTGDHPWAQLSQMQAIYQARTLSSFLPQTVTFLINRLAPPQNRQYPLIYQPMLKTFYD